MLRIITLAVASSLLALSACKKAELPESFSGEKVFWANYQFDGQALADTAGVQGLYLFTKIKKNNSSVFQMSGSLAPADCPEADCPGSFTMRLRSRLVLDSAFSFGPYGYYLKDELDSIFQQVYLDAAPSFAGAFSSTWTVNGSTVLMGESVSFRNAQPGPAPVQLRVERADGYWSQSERFVLPNIDWEYPNVQIWVDQIPGDSTLHLQLTQPYPLPNLQYQWNTGSTNAGIKVLPGPGASYAVTVTNPNNNSTATAALRLPVWMAGERSTGFAGSIVKINTNRYNLVVLEKRDAAGVLWSSELGEQASDAFFEVLNVEPYEKNEHGEPTRKLSIRYNCRLYSDSGDWKNLEGTAVLAVVWQ